MVRVVSNSKVYSKQQSSFNNKSITFYGKLYKRVENGSRHKKKRKSGESNRAYRENEKSLRESWNSIERKTQVEIKQQADKRQREVEEWKKYDKVMLSTKNLVFKERPVKKLTERYVKLYMIEEVVSKNTVKLKLPASIRIHLVVNVSRVVRYREPMKGQKSRGTETS